MSRKIDVLVAEHVMGHELEYDESFHPTEPFIGTYAPVPDYSTDLGRAWEVVEEMRSQLFWYTLQDLTIRHTVGKDHYCMFVPNQANVADALKNRVYSKCKSVTMAICTAALKAKGVDPNAT